VLKRNQLHEYQKRCVGFAKATPKCALFLDMGLGKTVSTLTVLTDLFNENKIINTEQEYLHNMFIGINKPQEVLNLTGYFKFVNNSIK